MDLSLLQLTEHKEKETLKNPSLTKLLLNIIELAKKEIHHEKVGSVSKVQGTLLYQLGTKTKPQIASNIEIVVRFIISGGIKTELQLSAAVEYLLTHAVAESINIEEFKRSAGVDVVVTDDDIDDAISKVIAKNKDAIVKERYLFNTGKLYGEVRALLPWADGGKVKREADVRIFELIGVRTPADDAAASEKKKKGGSKEAKPNKQAEKSQPALSSKAEINGKDLDVGASSIEELMRTRANFHKVGENYKTDGYVTTPRTKEILAKHVSAVGGKVVTRFPPEPNGVLHIGHAKAININFGYAKAHEGKCYLRFDDTNPEKEEEKFFTAIEDIVKWLGYTPCAITHSSDNFQQLYEWAITLIKKDLAYVCHQTVEEMRGHEVQLSPYRNRPIAESLQLFEDMKNGKFDEGEATLRLKLTLEEGKVDPVAYRIKYVPHHRTGDKWCIYPTYDYTHCLCDSIENITHSMCTKEFQSRRSSYYWLCNALDIYCPVQWEYGRLNVNYTVVSKRKILKLIETKMVNDWDDPRLFTLTALRRRGIPAEAINKFVAKLGLTMSQMVIDPHVLDATVRDYLNATAPRTMAVLDGLRIRIANFEEAKLPTTVSVPDFPSDPSCSSSHNVAFGPIIFIEKDDYRQNNPDKGFRRLTKIQAVGLKHVGVLLRVKEEILNRAGHIEELVVTAHPLTEEKPKAFVHWVSNPVSCEVRLYDRLFKHKNPEDPQTVPNGFLSDVNQDSLTVLYNVLIDRSIASSKVYDRFQFERIGYFSVDQDSTPSKLVFNRTVLLKEDAGK